MRPDEDRASRIIVDLADAADYTLSILQARYVERFEFWERRLSELDEQVTKAREERVHALGILEALRIETLARAQKADESIPEAFPDGKKI